MCCTKIPLIGVTSTPLQQEAGILVPSLVTSPAQSKNSSDIWVIRIHKQNIRFKEKLRIQVGTELDQAQLPAKTSL